MFILRSYLLFCEVVSEDFLCISNRIRIIHKQTYLTHRLDPNRYYHRVRVKLGVMAMKCYSKFPRSPELELHHPM